MSRIYDAQSLVELPRLDAASAAAVGTALVAAAGDPKKLKANVAAAVARLVAALVALNATLVSGLGAAPESGLRSALRAEAALWAGIHEWLKGFAAKGTPEQTTLAEKLQAALFANGLLFLRSAAAKRWTDTDTRIQMIDKENLAADFAKLGGAAPLQRLRDAHKATGIAAGITTPKAAVETAPVREDLDALKAAMRNHVLQVVANASADDTAAATALAEKLLQPLLAYVPPETGKTAPAPLPPQA